MLLSFIFIMSTKYYIRCYVTLTNVIIKDVIFDLLLSKTCKY